jgi:hypothetical protein
MPTQQLASQKRHSLKRVIRQYGGQDSFLIKDGHVLGQPKQRVDLRRTSYMMVSTTFTPPSKSWCMMQHVCVHRNHADTYINDVCRHTYTRSSTCVPARGCATSTCRTCFDSSSGLRHHVHTLYVHTFVYACTYE